MHKCPSCGHFGSTPARHWEPPTCFRTSVSISASRSTWEWLGIYCCHGQRIYGFQGHPMYHVTQYSGAWNAPAPSDVQGAHTALNTEHDNTRDLVEQCLFG